MEAGQFEQIRPRHREDAVQEAWVGYLESLRDFPGDEKRAREVAWRRAHAYRVREWRRERHQVAESQTTKPQDDSTPMGLGKRRGSTRGLSDD